MSEYRLTSTAIRHIDEISDYSAERFGEVQTDAYMEGLKRAFGLLADFPKMGMAAFELRPKLRRFVYGSHVVFHTPHADVVQVNAVIYGKREMRRHMLDF